MAASGSLDSFQFYVVHNSFERYEHGSWDILQFVLFRRKLAELYNQAKFLFEIFYSNNINNIAIRQKKNISSKDIPVFDK